MIITMHHHHNSNHAGTEPPRILPNMELTLPSRIVRVFHDDVEHLCARKVLAKAVRRGALDPASRCGYESFKSSGVESSGEFLLFRFDTRYDRDGEEVFVNLAVEVEDMQDFSIGLSFGEVGRVTFLPEEFACAEEGLGVFKFPTDD